MKHLLLLLTVLLAACQAGIGYQHAGSRDAPPEISRLVLNEEFSIRPDRASEYIQYGKIMPYDKISEYYPHCNFELRTVSESARVVHPDEFVVTGIYREQYMAKRYRKVMLASAGDDGGNMMMSATQLYLESARQPEVFRLNCQQLDEPFLARHVTTEEIAKALGSLFTVVPATN